MSTQVLFSIGQLIDHKVFGYRGVIFDVDDHFKLNDEWYERVAYSRPPKDQPWYHVMVDNSGHCTYVAERNLKPAADRGQIDHPWLGRYFKAFIDGRYISRQSP